MHCSCFNLLYPTMSRGMKDSKEYNQTIGVHDAFN